MAITPDTKNWTWVLDRSCPECGFDAAARAFREVPGLLRSSAEDWRAILAGPAAAERPDEDTWSALEYAAHVRDLCRIYRMRLRLMLADDGAEFADWDQDATAVAKRYAEQDPAVVAAGLAAEAEETAAAFAAVESGTALLNVIVATAVFILAALFLLGRFRKINAGKCPAANKGKNFEIRRSPK